MVVKLLTRNLNLAAHIQGSAMNSSRDSTDAIQRQTVGPHGQGAYGVKWGDVTRKLPLIAVLSLWLTDSHIRFKA